MVYGKEAPCGLPVHFTMYLEEHRKLTPLENKRQGRLLNMRFCWVKGFKKNVHNLDMFFLLCSCFLRTESALLLAEGHALERAKPLKPDSSRVQFKLVIC